MCQIEPVQEPQTIRTDSGLRRITDSVAPPMMFRFDTAVTVVAKVTVTSIGVALVLALLCPVTVLRRWFRPCLNAMMQAAAKAGLRTSVAHVSDGRNPRRHCIWAGSAPSALPTASLSRADTSQRQNLVHGVHPAIIDDDLWDAVQTKLQTASAKRRGVKKDQGVTEAPLAPATRRWRALQRQHTPTINAFFR
jgi:hypothetical protein